MAGYGEGLGTGLPNDHDYNDAELAVLRFLAHDLGDLTPPAKIKVLKNPDAETFFGGAWVFPWEVHCPDHGEVDAFMEHSMAMAEAREHIETEHRQGVRCRWYEDKCQHGYWIDDAEVTTEATIGTTKRLCPLGKAASA